jgi:hypothetical protein
MSRALPSLAHALAVAPDLNAALVAMGEALMESDRAAVLALLHYDGRKEILRERLTPTGGHVETGSVDTTFDHLPPNVRTLVSGGGQFVDLGERSGEYARLLGLSPFADGGLLSLRGLTTDGNLAAVLQSIKASSTTSQPPRSARRACQASNCSGSIRRPVGLLGLTNTNTSRRSSARLILASLNVSNLCP